MNILITGCAGFIGYNLIERLKNKKKLNLIGVDNIFKDENIIQKKKDYLI